MIELHFAEPVLGLSSSSLRKVGLSHWVSFFEFSDTLVGYEKALDLDIVISDIPFRRFQSKKSADPMACLVEAYERGRVVTQSLPEPRMKWITLCGRYSSIIPNRDNPIQYSLLGHESIGAMALMEGGANFVTRDGQVLGNNQWEDAEEYFLRLLKEYGLVT